MNQQDALAFFDLLDATYDLIGVGTAKVISPAAKKLFYTDLERYPLEYIEKALAAHRQEPERGKFTPKPADIIYQIERRMPVQWLSADEAWPQMPKTEDDSGLLNQCTAKALAVAMPHLVAGDDTAARMAFRASYNRLVEQEKLAKRGPEYFLSPGRDKLALETVRASGIEQGLIAGPESAKSGTKMLETNHAGLAKIRAMLTVKEIPNE